MKNYGQYINEAEMALSDVNLTGLFNTEKKTKEELERLAFREIGRQGKLIEYIDQGNTVKFGMLKALYHDALAYKKKREYGKGIAKFILRAIPLALAPIFFPLWLISQILGGTRAVNKVIIPSLKMDHRNYNSFLRTLMIKTLNLAEGDIKPFIGKDWYYDVFSVHDGLTKMVKKELLLEFAVYICREIDTKDDDEDVPQYWLDNEFRKWLNNKFDIDLPTGKKMIKNKS